MIHYFAYGSNLDRVRINGRCSGAALLCAGCLKGYRLDFTRYSPTWRAGVADVVEDESAEVWGLVYTLTELDLERLDACESYPHGYDRFRASIENADRILEAVWTYTVREKASFSPPVRSYLDILKRAAEDHGFPEPYRRSLDEVPLQHG